MRQILKLKTGIYYYEDIEKKTLDIIRRHGLEDKVMFSSFNHVSLIRIRGADAGGGLRRAYRKDGNWECGGITAASMDFRATIRIMRD